MRSLSPLLLVAALVVAPGCPVGAGDAGASGHEEVGGGEGEGEGEGDGEEAPPPDSAFFALLSVLDDTAQDARQELVDQWLVTHAPTFPFVDGDVVTFLYVADRGEESVVLAGDVTAWDFQPEPLTRVPGTTLSHVSYRLPVDARVDYKFIVDGEWILDPNNPATVPSGFGPNSEVAMPAWDYPEEIDFLGDIPHGTVNGVLVGDDVTYPPLSLTSTVLDNTRNVWIYTPPGADAGQAYPLLVVHDGGEYLHLARMAVVLDNLLHDGAIEPLVVAFVDPVDRGPEYVGARVPQMLQLIEDELLPFVQARAPVSFDPARRGMMGASNGGYLSVRAARDLGHLFRRIGSQSGALCADATRATCGTAGVLGSFLDGEVPADTVVYADTGVIVDFDVEHDAFTAALRAAGYTHTARKWNEGHSWGNWRGHLDELLLTLFPAR